jgi:hypothetical protein
MLGVRRKDHALHAFDRLHIRSAESQQHRAGACVRYRVPVRTQERDATFQEVHTISAGEEALRPRRFSSRKDQRDSIAVVSQLTQPSGYRPAIRRIEPHAALPLGRQTALAFVLADVAHGGIEWPEALRAWVEIERAESLDDVLWGEPCVGLPFMRYRVAREERRTKRSAQ